MTDSIRVSSSDVGADSRLVQWFAELPDQPLYHEEIARIGKIVRETPILMIRRRCRLPNWRERRKDEVSKTDLDGSLSRFIMNFTNHDDIGSGMSLGA